MTPSHPIKQKPFLQIYLPLYIDLERWDFKNQW